MGNPGQALPAIDQSEWNRLQPCFHELPPSAQAPADGTPDQQRGEDEMP
jgi:hypothetical protein